MKVTSAQLQNKTTNAETAGHVGTVELKMWSMASTRKDKMKTYKVKIIRESIVEAKDEEEAKDLAFDSMIMGDVDFEVEEDDDSNV